MLPFCLTKLQIWYPKASFWFQRFTSLVNLMLLFVQFYIDALFNPLKGAFSAKAVRNMFLRFAPVMLTMT